MSDNKTLVIIPFGCIPLSGIFRVAGKTMRREKTLFLCKYAHYLDSEFHLVELSEERLVVTFKSILEEDALSFIVEEIEC